ncbi:hypothetical protein [Reticulibacter mediterranei]|uniref:hypothetical protein n=1 Tax=Reticulibacter mediterranei TaxID=2778369 RepID=UPI001C6900E9|nr:hypothetical protein [Reticulibacter mediterranei]
MKTRKRWMLLPLYLISQQERVESLLQSGSWGCQHAMLMMMRLRRKARTFDE